MNEYEHLLFHQYNEQNKINYRYNQGINKPDSNYEHYLLQFDRYDKISLEDHRYVQNQQEKFRSDISKYEIRQCITCFERWHTTINLGRYMNFYQC